jgi:hypothetical protein
MKKAHNFDEEVRGLDNLRHLNNFFATYMIHFTLKLGFIKTHVILYIVSIVSFNFCLVFILII